MSWNNQGGGPWRSQGRGPWGQGPSGPQPTADLEEIIRRVQEALGKLSPGGVGRRRVGRRRVWWPDGPVCDARGDPGVVRLGHVLYRAAQ